MFLEFRPVFVSSLLLFLVAGRVLDVPITRRIIQGAWLLSLALALPPLVGWSNYTRESTANTCSVNWSMDSANNLSYIIFIVILGYVLPIVILFFCYFKVGVYL